MKVLITGAAGFVGKHLIHELRAHNHNCIASDRVIVNPVAGAMSNEAVDICDGTAVNELIARTQPDACIHMAGITSVNEGAVNPDLMLAVNVRGTTNLLDAIRVHAPETRLLTTSTAHVYGTPPRDQALTEHSPLAPLSMYAISKAAADLATLAYANHFGLQAMVARPNNHTGPGQQTRFVVAAFAQQVRDIAVGASEPVIRVGNLESERNFTDVRDVVRAYRLLIEAGEPGQAYNVSSQHTERIGDMLKKLCRMGGVSPRFDSDPDLVRPTDWSPRLDTTRLEQVTGWKPEISFEETLQDMLNVTQKKTQP
ncbi:MAG: GDP-mannose 4,6-dehydratase [Lentisphaerae bacterium]|nr:GDP-mannose 4,6-dehydratase [Lentisphaerota bacterium]